jgi:hypothetical protein
MLEIEDAARLALVCFQPRDGLIGHALSSRKRLLADRRGHGTF